MLLFFSVFEIQLTRINCARASVLHAARDVFFSTYSHVVVLNRIVHSQPLNKGNISRVMGKCTMDNKCSDQIALACMHAQSDQSICCPMGLKIVLNIITGFSLDSIWIVLLILT